MTKSKFDERLIAMQLKDETLREVAFATIVEQYSRQIYWHIRNMVVSHEDADDLVQETFIKAWNNLDKFRGDSQISTWLYRIAINETLTFIKKKSQREIIALSNCENEVIDMIAGDSHFNGDRADALLREAVSKLPEKQRLVFSMRYFEDMKYEDISEILETTVGSLKASYHIAVKKIEQYISEND